MNDEASDLRRIIQAQREEIARLKELIARLTWQDKIHMLREA